MGHLVRPFSQSPRHPVVWQAAHRPGGRPQTQVSPGAPGWVGVRAGPSSSPHGVWRRGLSLCRAGPSGPLPPAKASVAGAARVVPLKVNEGGWRTASRAHAHSQATWLCAGSGSRSLVRGLDKQSVLSSLFLTSPNTLRWTVLLLFYNDRSKLQFPRRSCLQVIQ